MFTWYSTTLLLLPGTDLIELFPQYPCCHSLAIFNRQITLSLMRKGNSYRESSNRETRGNHKSA